MVDNRYLGRGEKSKRYLDDAEVDRLHAARRQADADIRRLLEAEIDRDPVPAASRRHSHRYLLAQPAAGRPDLLLPILDASTWREQLSEVLQEAAQPIPDLNDRFSPDDGTAIQFQPRAAGAAASSHQIGRGREILNQQRTPRSENALDIKFRHDGGLRIWMGRLSDRDSNDQEVVLAIAAVLHTRRLIALTTAVATSSGYLGNWDLGFAATGLRGRGVGDLQSRPIVGSRWPAIWPANFCALMPLAHNSAPAMRTDRAWFLAFPR